ncbi:hypothetical protein [Herpetosiphon geysericola]|uniref:Uncharacterized protein n=1 Tax=Herpetosiphon geysericola TaxID=70996 RepID=A0A0N8GQ92_9CHLR|nr:hypothetical protein [Herpetosiphon geysericola]KPL83050.1 hypothetical protein SE18_19610 [Herpetosiphon geysericola]
MNPTTIQWFCVGMAMGCLFVSIIAAIVYWLPESDPPFWSRNVAARSFMAAIAFIGVSIPTWIEPAAAARFEFWLLQSQRPMTGTALWCFILALVSIGIAVGASIAAIFSESDWIGRWQTVARYARRACLSAIIMCIVFWNLGA